MLVEEWSGMRSKVCSGSTVEAGAVLQRPCSDYTGLSVIRTNDTAVVVPSLEHKIMAMLFQEGWDFIKVGFACLLELVDKQVVQATLPSQRLHNL